MDDVARQVRGAIDVFVAREAGRSVAVKFAVDRHAGGCDMILDAGGDVVRPVASVIKIALMMALYDAANSGLLSLDDEVPVNALGETRYCSIMRAFGPSRALTLAELAAIGLITSDNPVAVKLDEIVGRDAVDAVLARVFGHGGRRMTAGFREDELGAKNRVNAMRAIEVLRLLDALTVEPRYAPIVVALENNLRNARIPALLPDEAVTAHKTGSLEGVVNDAGIVRLGPESFSVAFLCDGQSDAMATSADIATCSKVLFDAVL